VVDSKLEPEHGDRRPSPEVRAAGLHEATNALTVILGWLDRATEAARGVREAERALERATSHALRARNGLRRAIGADTPEEAPERVAQVAQQCTEDLAIEAERATVRLRLAIEAPWGEARVGHPHAIWQVLSNLLLNAIALSPEDGAVDLRVSGHQAVGTPMVRFTVLDQGPGLSAERAKHIFAGHGPGRAGGAGIGLPHARALASMTR
jgi:signal transduction histidine kinase